MLRLSEVCEGFGGEGGRYGALAVLRVEMGGRGWYFSRSGRLVGWR